MNFKLQREVEDLKLQVHQLRKEKQDTNQRLGDLETELKTLKIIFTNTSQFGNSNLLLHSMKTAENDFKNLHEERQANKKRNSLNLKYGQMNESLENEIEALTSSNTVQTIDYELMEKLCQRYSVPNLLSPPANAKVMFPNNNNFNDSMGKAVANSSTNSDLVQLEKDTFDLRRELQDAVAGKKQAESKIAA